MYRRKQIKFSSEKEFHQWFLTRLRKQGWVTFSEKTQKKSRPDIIIYRKDVNTYIGLELKLSDRLYHMTTALKQIMEYQNIPMTPQSTLWAIVVPFFSEEGWFYERFFWRFGIGTLTAQGKKITYMNTGKYNKNYVIHIDSPEKTILQLEKNTPDKTMKLIEKMKKDYIIWGDQK